MFQVEQTILPDEVALAPFACAPWQCKGACCVAGDTGAPVQEYEILPLQKIYHFLGNELPNHSNETINKRGLIREGPKGYCITCNNNGACVFALVNENGIAECSSQKAFNRGDLDFEKPLSCHLFPLGIKKRSNYEYVSYQYIHLLCKSACVYAAKEGVFLSGFLKSALVRKYGALWYDKFEKECQRIRKTRRVQS